jgi:hypothetical protein
MATARFNQRGAHLVGQEHVVRWLRSVGMPVARKKAKPVRRGDGKNGKVGMGAHPNEVGQSTESDASVFRV